MRREVWIRKARASLGDKWDYSLIPDNVSSGQKIQIKCPKHGVFEQNEKSHRKGFVGCKGCYGESVSKRYVLGPEELLKKLPLQDTDYLYCIPNEVRMKDKIRIKCPRHGVFEQGLVNHITVGQRCPACSHDRVVRAIRKDRRWFVNKMRAIHRGAYGYWAIPEAVSANDKVAVWCPKHGWFHVLVHNHISHRSRCPKCAVGTGKGELEIAQLQPGAELRKKNLLPVPCNARHEIDVWWPDCGVGVELHGAVWHSTKLNNDPLHLQRKADAAANAGIRLLQIYDFEWHNRRALFKAVILAALGKFDEVFMARKLRLAPAPAKEAISFLQRYHPKGPVNGRFMGLYDGSRLVMLAAYGNSRFARGHAELYRVVAMSGVRVTGGLSRLVKNIAMHEGKNIISYVDRRLFTGHAYEKIGFSLVKKNPPGYIYVDEKGNPVGSRVKYQKHKLSRTLRYFQNTLSEEENMKVNGFYRLYDAGTLTYLYEYGGG